MKFDAETTRRMLRNSNKFWNMMYYDGVIDLPNCHVSHFRNANRPYYNAAHALTSADEGTFSEIEKAFASVGVTPGVYLDPQAPEELQAELRKRGYIYVPSEDEHWYCYDVSKFVPSTCYVKTDPKRFYASVFKPSADDFERFLEIDTLVNDLTPEMQERLNHGLHMEDTGVDVRLILGYLDGKPVGTKAIGVIDGMAFTAEAATLTDCRRQGIATALTAEAVKTAKRLNASHIFVNCDAKAHSNEVHWKFGYEMLFMRHYFRKMGA